MAMSAAVKAKRTSILREKITTAEARVEKLTADLEKAKLIPGQLRAELAYLEQAPTRLEDQDGPTPEGFQAAEVPGFTG